MKYSVQLIIKLDFSKGWIPDMIWIAIIALIIALDQISKIIIINNINIANHPIRVIEGFFNIIHSENSGAAWGIMQNGRILFVVITPLVLAAIAFYLYKADNRFLRFSLSFVMGGAIGNFVDRVYKGSVTDFLDFNIFGYDFPTFNIADTFVVIGTILLAYYLLFIYKEKENAADEG